MRKERQDFSYDVYDSIEELPAQDASLLKKAQEVTSNAYAPYSHFHVGAAAQLHNGQIVTGSNQENASYPVGICAERVLLSSASSQFPNVPINMIAISYTSYDV
jgi:cytidine deaminase